MPIRAQSDPGQAHYRLTQAIGYANRVLDAVTPQLLSRPTPCHAWNLGQLLEHADESLAALHEGVTVGRVAARPGEFLADGPGTGADLVSAVRQRAAALLRASAQAGGRAPVAIGGYPLPLDCLRTTGALEVAVHGWDISQACGQQLPIPDELATDLLAQARLLVPLRDRHPLFAAPVPAPPEATPGDHLAAYLGRRSPGGARPGSAPR